jgi:hypothetical protein
VESQTSRWNDKVRNTHESHEVRISSPDCNRAMQIAHSL